MEYQVSVKPSVQKELNKIPKQDYYQILSAFTVLAQDPFIGKKLKGEYKGKYTYRVWPYRIVYEIHKKELVVLIIRIGHRQGVYT
jgi:mRNA interferase RelE/StbE